MAEERKPKMSIDELEAVLVNLPGEEWDDLLDRVLSQRESLEAEIDPAILERAHRTLEDIRAGRGETIPAEDVLDMLEPPTVPELEAVAMQIPADERAELVDRLIAGLSGRDGYDPEWVTELNRRVDEIEAGTAKTVPAEEVFAKMRARRNARSLSR
jgi:putative addiction module component (TIGR02574 family)